MPRPGRESARRGSDDLVLISWRDIPAQLTGRNGADRHQVMLPHRFQKAIDRAAMVAGKKTAQDYVGEWVRSTVPFDGDIGEAVRDHATRIEAAYPNERLHRLVNNGGWDPDAPARAGTHAPDPSPQPPETSV
jgi:hypothetical protein